MAQNPFDDDQAFEDRLGRAREKLGRGSEQPAGPSPAGQAMRMGVELVVGVVVGAIVGQIADRMFGTSPAFLIILVLLGFGAGVRNVVLTAQRMQSDVEKNT